MCACCEFARGEDAGEPKPEEAAVLLPALEPPALWLPLPLPKMVRGDTECDAECECMPNAVPAPPVDPEADDAEAEDV